MKHGKLAFCFLIFGWVAGFSACTHMRDHFKGNNSSAYSEKYRPQFHFSPDSMWMNDPNGMVYLDGEYHLFYQYYPEDVVWGPMHWGHAVSTDLVHWQHLPVALYPDDLGYIFSGSAVFDPTNSSGLGTSQNPPLVAVFTYHDPVGEKEGGETYQTQGIAFSLDKGRTWKKHEGNPVIPNPGIRDFRDPKVHWSEETEEWIMVLAADDRVKFYSSPNLISWSFLSDFGMESGSHGGVWECPDIFPLQVNGENKWVLLVSINPGAPNGGSGTQYFIGNFDGKTFKEDNPGHESKWLDYGRDNYAGVTWANVPGSDGRTLFIGWMSNWHYGQDVPTSPWRSAMTVVRNLSLQEVNNQLVLVASPVVEMDQLKEGKTKIAAANITQENTTVPLASSTGYIQLSINPEDAENLVFALRNDIGETVRLIYKTSTELFMFNRDNSGETDFEPRFKGEQVAPRYGRGNLELEFFIDESSIEIFADGGKTNITNLVFPTQAYNQLLISTTNGQAQLISGSTQSLKSIWNPTN